MKKINIFILAAGLGERLRPVTDHIPKPLIPVLGKPSIRHVFDQMSDLPFERIGINLHYKGEVIEEWVRHCLLYEKIVLFPEEEILGTGGALKNAGNFLREGTFIVHNSDILSDINLVTLLDHHRSSHNVVTLAVHDYPKFNCLVVDDHGFLKYVGAGFKPGPSDGQALAFTGIAVYEPGFLDYVPNGKSSVVDAWTRAIAAGEKIGTFDVCRDGVEPRPFWSDIGSPDTYAATLFDLLRREGEMVYIHPSIGTCAETEIQGYVVIEEGCDLERGVLLRNSIVLPGSKAPSGAVFENCILGPGFTIQLNQSEILRIDEDKRQLIGSGGSDRRYYRIKKDNRDVVLMQCSVDDPDFERQVEYTRHLLKHDVPVPALIEVDNDKNRAFIEDAGDISLYSWLKCPRDRMGIEHIYRQVIDIMVLIHTDVTADIAACPLLESRVFDYEHFRWETDYFIKRFAEGVRNINIKNLSALNEELHQLAVKADSLPRTVIHRDFQSQNIMVMKGPELRLIDYQGARIGPPAYDVASLLWDPYFHLDDETRGRLLDHYVEKMKAHDPGKFDDAVFLSSLVLCRLQRHMQALGAYGFLSLVKGKKYFQKYMPEGLRLLKDDAGHVKDYFPVLYELIMSM